LNRFTFDILKHDYLNFRCLPHSSLTYSRADSVEFPSCIWSMRSLKQLYIAGNGLKGNLQNFDMSNLATLIINSNRFTGTLSVNMSFHRFKVLDISSNQITGYLNSNWDPNENHDKIEFYADINRLSGPVNVKIIDLYAFVGVLSGNSISCGTLPSSDSVYTDSVFFSECETRQVYFAILIWCITLSVFLITTGINYAKVAGDSFLWAKQYKFCLNSKIIKLKFPKSLQLVTALQKFHKLVLILSLCVVLALLALYSGFEFSKNANEHYKVLFEKYNYAFSGIYLKSVSPAAVIFIVFTLTSVMYIYIVYRVFLLDWAVITNATIFFQPLIVSNSTEIRYVLGRYFLLICFLSISLGINVAYVYGLSQSDNVLPLQIAYFICNAFYIHYGSYLFLSYLYKNAHLMKVEAAFFHTIMITFSGIINPCLATLVIDSNCFRYAFDRAAIDSSYSYQHCTSIDSATQTCSTIREFHIASSFTPPFIYGHRCRDAVFGNYIPVIFLSCAFNTFVYPFFYAHLTNGIQSLSFETTLFSFSIDSRRLVFENTLVYFIEGIMFDLVLMILFGIAYPLCFVFLTVDFTSRIYLLIQRFHLYAELYQRTIDNNPDVDKVNSEYLEDMVSDAILTVPYLIWPGFGAASVIFGFYLFDMAWDTPNNYLSAPIVLLVLIITSFFMICVVFFKAKAQANADLSSRVKSLSPVSDVELRASITNNPILVDHPFIGNTENRVFCIREDL